MLDAGFEEVLVSGQEHIRTAGNGGTEYGPVCCIAQALLRFDLRLWNRHNLNGHKRKRKEAVQRVQLCRKLPVEYTPQLVKILLAHHGVIRLRDRLDIGQKRRAAGTERRRNEDVRVYEDFHSSAPSLRISAMSVFTSSSFTRPLLFASPAISFCSICIA